MLLISLLLSQWAPLFRCRASTYKPPNSPFYLHPGVELVLNLICWLSEMVQITIGQPPVSDAWHCRHIGGPRTHVCATAWLCTARLVCLQDAKGRCLSSAVRQGHCTKLGRAPGGCAPRRLVTCSGVCSLVNRCRLHPVLTSFVPLWLSPPCHCAVELHVCSLKAQTPRTQHTIIV